MNVALPRIQFNSIDSHYTLKFFYKMKNSIIILLLIGAFQLMAQNNEGTIHFTETIKIDIQLPEGQEHLKDLIPSTRESGKVLYFNAKKSMYRDVDPEEEESESTHEMEDGNVQIKMVMAAPDNRILREIESGKTIEQRDFMGKKFLFKGSVEQLPWKIVGEQKKILDFLCQKAVYADTSINITAWFTPQIPLATGPDNYGNLPGMILEVNIDEGQRIISANKVAFDNLPEDALETPKKGKKVTKEEYEKIREAKLKEMQEQFGGSGGAVIKMEMRN